MLNTVVAVFIVGLAGCFGGASAPFVFGFAGCSGDSSAAEADYTDAGDLRADSGRSGTDCGSGDCGGGASRRVRCDIDRDCYPYRCPGTADEDQGPYCQSTCRSNADCWSQFVCRAGSCVLPVQPPVRIRECSESPVDAPPFTDASFWGSYPTTVDAVQGRLSRACVSHQDCLFVEPGVRASPAHFCDDGLCVPLAELTGRCALGRGSVCNSTEADSGELFCDLDHLECAIGCQAQTDCCGIGVCAGVTTCNGRVDFRCVEQTCDDCEGECRQTAFGPICVDSSTTAEGQPCSRDPMDWALFPNSQCGPCLTCSRGVCSRSCEAPLTDGEVCVDVREDAAGDGVRAIACELGDECPSGTRCSKEANGDACVPFSGQPLGSGDFCDPREDDCDEGLICSAFTSTCTRACSTDLECGGDEACALQPYSPIGACEVACDVADTVSGCPVGHCQEIPWSTPAEVCVSEVPLPEWECGSDWNVCPLGTVCMDIWEWEPIDLDRPPSGPERWRCVTECGDDVECGAGGRCSVSIGPDLNSRGKYCEYAETSADQCP
ncbi:MAG: hypothetical protein H6700_01755 [Myxococcales bacterium]|nr:hypothetical protein [Myxococcales bacterium]MCB9519781.1 hypothetical protein [Myxococcales bacterium]MCB9530472.1 hypothetical protein [Myxococcales bacterium]